MIALLLTGCTAIKSENIYSDLDNYLANLDSADKFRTNNSTEFYSYYLPSDMQELDCTNNSSSLTYNNAEIVMNLNIPAIVSGRAFNDYTLKNDGFFKESLLEYEKEGYFPKDDESTCNYAIRIYYDDNKYLVHFQTEELNFYCLCDASDVVDVVKHLFTISESADVDKNLVVANYSNKDIIEYQRKQVNLFRYEIPQSGFLSELVNQTGGTVEIQSEMPNEENTEEEIPEEEAIEETEE